MSIGKKLVLAAVLTALCGFPGFAQTETRSYYVSANGNDETNNGRSEEAPFKTLAKAADMAAKGTVKRITIIGTLNGSMRIENNGTAEILITGKSDTEKAYLVGGGNGSVITIFGKGSVRFENVEISGGYSKIGGGIDIGSAVVTLGKGVKISNNKIIARDNSLARTGGAGVGGDSGTLLMLDGATISENTDVRDDIRASAVSVSTFTMTGGTISGNEGNGVSMDSGTFTMTGGTISGNTNGGVFMWRERGNTFTMTGGTISGNKNRGVYVGGSNNNRPSTITMSGGTISGNTAGSIGGGVYVDSGTFTMSGNATITGNTANGYGGGVYVNHGTFTMSGGTISGNTASGKSHNISDGNGGGVYVDSGTFTMSGNATITGNTANNGGGISAYSTSVVIKGGSVTKNTAKKNGGGIYAENVTMAAGVVSGNKAEYGGGVYIGKSLTMTGGKINGNGAEFVGGGVYLVTGSKYVPGKAVVSGNTAGDGEGADVFRQQ